MGRGADRAGTALMRGIVLLIIEASGKVSPGAVLLSGALHNAPGAGCIGRSAGPVAELAAVLSPEQHSNPQAVAEIGTKFAGFLPHGNRFCRDNVSQAFGASR